MEHDFEKDIKINRFKLDEECEIHPSLYQYWSDELAKCRAKKDAEEEKLSFMTSEIELQCRRDPPEEIGKVTEKAVQSYLDCHPDLVKQKQKVLEVKKELYTLDSAVKALEHRKSMLNNLVDLWGQNYFSLPQGHRKKTSTDDAQLELRKKMNKRKDRDNGEEE